MLSNRLAFAALGVAWIAAAAGGGYLASRQNAVPAPVAAISTSLPADAQGPAVTPERPVQETEAIVAEAPKPAAFPAPAPAAKSSPASPAPKRGEAVRPPAREPRPAQTVARQEPQTPPLTSTWPSSASQPPSPAPIPPSDTVRPGEPVAPEPPKAPEPPQKT